MSNVKDAIPRSDMTVDQKRRIGALQAAKQLIVGNYGNGSLEYAQVHQVLEVARYVEKG